MTSLSPSVSQSISQAIEVPVITSDGVGQSTFSTRRIELNGTEERQLSDQIQALNFRIRQSDSSYKSGFHVAGDPTLLLILSGAIRVDLRSGEYKKFSNGEMFIAEDFLDPDVVFDESLHGHKASVIGESQLLAVHIKLDKR